MKVGLLALSIVLNDITQRLKIFFLCLSFSNPQPPTPPHPPPAKNLLNLLNCLMYTTKTPFC
jgi:hypothetical protein